jgi:hypothetical protein
MSTVQQPTRLSLNGTQIYLRCRVGEKTLEIFPHILAVMFFISQNSSVRAFENLILEKQ